MKTCEDHQLALEMRRHGALDAEALAEVEAHLATCADCQKAEARAGAVDSMLRKVPVSTPVDPAVLLAKAAKAERWASLLPLGMIASFALQGALMSAVMPGSMLKNWSYFLVAGVVFAAGAAFVIGRQRRKAKEALKTGIDVWLADLRRQRWDSYIVGKYMRPGSVLLSLGTIAGAARVSAQGGHLAAVLWVAAGLLTLGVPVIWWMAAVAKRQLQELGEELGS